MPTHGLMRLLLNSPFKLLPYATQFCIDELRIDKSNIAFIRKARGRNKKVPDPKYVGKRLLNEQIDFVIHHECPCKASIIDSLSASLSLKSFILFVKISKECEVTSIIFFL